jgi:glycosyltransferase involved in cell wall biosynthesis
VCFLGPFAYPLFDPSVRETFGGAEVHLYLLATRLARDPRFEVHFIVGDHGQAPLETREGVLVHRGPSWGRGYLGAARALWAIGALVRRIRPGVLVQRAASSVVGVLRFLAWGCVGPVLYMTAHEIDCNGEYERRRGIVSGQLFRFGIRRADLIVSQSEAQRAMLAAHHGRDSRVLPPAHDVPDEAEVRRAERDIVLWVGRCDPTKRPEAFLDLARRIPGERFVMVAPVVPGGSAYFEDVRDRATALPNVEHVAFVPFREIDAYFRRAKAYVLTSGFEGFPNTFVQAAKNGTPILSLDFNPDGFLDRHECGGCARGDLDRLHDMLTTLLRDRVAWERQSGNAWRYARAHHGLDAVVQQFGTLLVELAAAGRRR